MHVLTYLLCTSREQSCAETCGLQPGGAKGQSLPCHMESLSAGEPLVLHERSPACTGGNTWCELSTGADPGPKKPHYSTCFTQNTLILTPALQARKHHGPLGRWNSPNSNHGSDHGGDGRESCYFQLQNETLLTASCAGFANMECPSHS